MNYALGYALNVEELFSAFPKKKLKMTSKQCEATVHNRNKLDVASKIFIRHVQQVIKDIIENSATFKLPTGAKQSEIYVKKFQEDDFVQCRQNGKFSDVNFILSNFTGHQLAFLYQYGGVFKEKLIYLDSKNKQRLTDLTNKGKAYY